MPTLYRVRRLLISAHESLSEHVDSKRWSLLTAGKPNWTLLNTLTPP
ncbi:MAG: hypothetical protein KTU85_04865 [Acidimicrobiia bacterium]|nr:hypothetical protein [Acidimicrobiia bacterium]MCY4457556.1 hypothetical protein [Acidimicrobiaceae bacterium]